MSRAHTQALVVKLEEIPVLDGKTFVTRAPKGTLPPYAILHPAKGTNTQERVTGPRSTKHPRFTLHVVGESADQVQLISDLVEVKLLPAGRGIRIAVTGENSKPLWFESPLPVQVSTDPLPEVIYQVIETGWMTDPV